MRLIVTILFILFPFLSIGQTTYYFSPSGHDDNAGTSSGEAFKSILKANSLSLNPGDRLKFQTTQTWDSTLVITNSGTSGNPIVIEPYGIGMPKIEAGDSTGILLLNVQYVTVDGFEIEGSGIDTTNLGFTTSRGAGVHALSTATSGDRLEGIVIKNCLIHNIRTGVLISADHGYWPQTAWRGYNNTIIEDNEMFLTGTAGIYVWAEGYETLDTANHPGHKMDYPSLSSYPHSFWNADEVHSIHTNVIIRRNYVHHTWGFSDSSVFKSRTGSAIRVSNTTGGEIYDNKSEWVGNMYGGFSYLNIAAFEAQGTIGLNWYRNQASYTRVGNRTADAIAFDPLDASNHHATIFHNWAFNNDGPAFAYGVHNSSRKNRNNHICFNITWNNRLVTSIAQGAVMNLAGSFDSLYIYNNLLWETTTNFTQTTDWDIFNAYGVNNIFYAWSTYPTNIKKVEFLGNVYHTAFNDLAALRASPYYIELLGIDSIPMGRNEDVVLDNFSDPANMDVGEVQQLTKMNFLSSFSSVEFTLAQMDSIGLDTSRIPTTDFAGNSFSLDDLRPGPFQTSSGNITPDPPTDLVIDDDANTATWTLSSGYDEDDHEYSTNNGSSWTTASDNTVNVGNVSIPTGHFKVRVKADTGRDASSSLSSSEPFTNNIKIYGRRAIIL